MLRKVVLGSVGVATLIPVVGAATPIKDAPPNPQKPPPMKPSELPIYEAPHADYAEKVKSKSDNEVGYVRSMLLAPVRVMREQIFTKSISGIFKYLREEENKQVRYGAVAMGGLTGFIFGLRGGIIRRVFYAGATTTAMGYVCFPEETKDIMKNNSVLAKQYVNIAYNFLYGVKPGDPQLEVNFPELSFPKDFSEFVDMTVSLASSVKQAVMPPPSKEELKPDEKKE
ncbi:hypothetical protein HW555_011321 [Spodoptera exigua]|uniref:MICOS complex subunit n=1 Tax=Spodoptera exigua TaxID=7107 RepID=A0A835L1S2_SPOEX|nr:hypothetical protein HW555_011321 [Spodoptera exigua]